MDVTVVVATFGGEKWRRLAYERAIPSARAENGDGVVVVHHRRGTLASARNEALSMVRTEWVCHLDADDELEPRFLDAMRRGTADVRGPIARYVQGARERLWQPRVFGHTHNCTADCLPEGNWLLIGSVVRTDLLREAGGWRDYAWSEDWSTWIRCWKAGGTFELIPGAVYRAHVDPQSRNRGATKVAKQAAHEAIYAANFPAAAA